MSAILRTGKFLRVVSGFARSQQPQQQNQYPYPNHAQGTSGTFGGAAHNQSTSESDGHPNHQSFGWDFTTQQPWSLQHFNSALPVVTVTRNEDDYAERRQSLKLDGGKKRQTVKEQDVQSLVDSIYGQPAHLAEKRALLAIKLCGNLESKQDESTDSNGVFVNQVWTELEEKCGVDMNVLHYNALLEVYLQTNHHFCPEFMLNRIKRHSVKPTKETFEALLTKCVNESNLESARFILTEMKSNRIECSDAKIHDLILRCAEKKSSRLEQWILFAKSGNLEGIVNSFENTVKESKLEVDEIGKVLEVLLQEKHSDKAMKLLKESEKYLESTAEHLEVCRRLSGYLVSSNEDHLAFEIVKEMKGDLSPTFLSNLVTHKRPVTKLLWFVEEMRRLNICSNPLDILMDCALGEKNFSLSLKLAEVVANEDQSNSSKNILCPLLDLCQNSLDVFLAIKSLSKSINKDQVKDIVLPKIESSCCRGESLNELVNQLSYTDLEASKVTDPLIAFLLERSRVDDAKQIANENAEYVGKEFSWLLSKQTNLSSTVNQNQGIYANDQQQRYAAIAMVQMFDPETQSLGYWPLPVVLQNLSSQGLYWDLEHLLDTSVSGFTMEDRKSIYLYTLQTYMALGLYDKAIRLTSRLEAEGLAFNFPAYHVIMSQFAASVGYNSTAASTSRESSTPTNSLQELQRKSKIHSQSSTRPSSRHVETPETPNPNELQQRAHKALKRAINDKNCEKALEAFLDLKKIGKHLNVTESSSLIELLVKGGEIKEAATLARDMLKRDAYPLPKIFRFLLNKLAAEGEVDLMCAIGVHLSPKVKKEVSFDNRLCNAYLSSGRASEFLDIIEKEVDTVTPDTLQSVKDKFPRGGAMGLLENNPELLEKYSSIAQKFADLGYVAPINVLWSYYFINSRHEEARQLWDKYLKDCPQIMFQKVCQTARSELNFEMASRLVDLLRDAEVTTGARGIAFSCLLDVLTQRGEFMAAKDKLRSALANGIQIEDINRTALLRLSNGLESIGEENTVTSLVAGQ